ncbi:MAG: hypothetical protein ACI9VR_003620 [Cognaticolwellia sp.]|jgi:hypothetical protein
MGKTPDVRVGLGRSQDALVLSPNKETRDPTHRVAGQHVCKVADGVIGDPANALPFEWRHPTHALFDLVDLIHGVHPILGGSQVGDDLIGRQGHPAVTVSLKAPSARRRSP